MLVAAATDAEAPDAPTCAVCLDDFQDGSQVPSAVTLSLVGFVLLSLAAHLPHSPRLEQHARTIRILFSSVLLAVPLSSTNASWLDAVSVKCDDNWPGP